MDSKYYSIGETAKIMGITVQTLRYYSKMGLVAPKYVNQDTGYRYYTADQFHYIDRIRYLQEFGLSLADITDIISSGSVDRLLVFLEKRKRFYREELEQIQNDIDDIQWYIDYFSYMGQEDTHPDIPYKRSLGKRYLVVAKCYSHDTPEDFHIRLNSLRSSALFKNLRFRRQFAYILDFDALMRKELRRLYLGMYLKNPPDFESEHIFEVPAGDYICFKGRILTEDWNPSYVSDLFAGKEKPSLVLSNEYEDSLVDYHHSMYEFQILQRKATGL